MEFHKMVQMNKPDLKIDQCRHTSKAKQREGKASK